MAQLAERELTQQERVVAFREALDDIERAVNLVKGATLRLVDAELVGALDVAAEQLYGLSRMRTQLEIQYSLFVEPHEQSAPGSDQRQGAGLDSPPSLIAIPETAGAVTPARSVREFGA